MNRPSFDVLFQSWNGKTHRNGTVNITESLQAAASVDVYEATNGITGLAQLDSIRDLPTEILIEVSWDCWGTDFRDFIVDPATGTISSRVLSQLIRDNMRAIDYLASDDESLPKLCH